MHGVPVPRTRTFKICRYTCHTYVDDGCLFLAINIKICHDYIINPRLQPRLQQFFVFLGFQKHRWLLPLKEKIPRSLGIFPTVIPRQPTPKSINKKSPMGAASSDFVDPETLPLQILLAEEAHQRAFWCWLLAGKEFKFNSEIRVRGHQICERKLSYVVEPAFLDGYVVRATFWWSIEPACSKAAMSILR